MKLEQRIALLELLGKYILQDTPERELALLRTEQHNRWLTQENSLQALENIATQFLTATTLRDFVAPYAIKEETSAQKVGLILAGNLPAVGFHDVLCTFLSGHQALVKYSDKDKYLIPYMVDYLIELEPAVADYIQSVDRLQEFDAVIATGSDNSAMYFERYFGKYPNIIRKNRNAIAILEGSETDDEIFALGKDIFTYYGLGCRSVSKLYVPEGYDLTNIMRVLDRYQAVMDQNKYKNNYDYNRSVYLLNRIPHLANDCFMLLENESLLSRIAALHYEYYTNKEDLLEKIIEHKEAIQCIATNMELNTVDTVGLGQTQCPTISDYADGVDTMQFLVQLN
jgi:hypothetical protein